MDGRICSGVVGDSRACSQSRGSSEFSEGGATLRSSRSTPQSHRLCSQTLLSILTCVFQICNAWPLSIFLPIFGDPLHLSEFQRKLEIHRGVVLILGFSFSFVFLLLYFLCEDGPCHYNRNTETAWLTWVVCLLSTTANLVYQTNGFLDCIYVWLINVQLFQQAGTPRMHPTFHDGFSSGDGRQVAEFPIASAEATRALAKLEVALAKVWQQKTYRSIVAPSDANFPVTIFIVVLLKFLSNPNAPWVVPRILHWAGFLLVCVDIFGFLDTMLKRTFAGPLVAQLVDIVERLTLSTNANDLEHILTNFSVATLFEVTEWKTACHLTQNALLEELLTIRSKAVLIDAIQKYGLRSSRAQHAVERIFLSCQGENLTKLKNLLDGRNTCQNLHYLVYRDITKASVRQTILMHFSSQARLARGEAGQRLGIKVLCDIDDTFFSSGGKFLSGRDYRYPKHVVYPGLLTLLDVIDRKAIFDSKSCNLAFLSAQPHLYRGVSEDRTYKVVKSVLRLSGRSKIPTFLLGSRRRGVQVVASFGCVRSRAWEPIGSFKYSIYVTFRALYPEYDFIFFGDNGHGDLLAGQNMLDSGRLHCEHEPKLLAVLIHQVVPDTDALAKESPSQRGPEWRQILEEKDLFLHTGYVGAALSLHTKHPDLVSLQELISVAEAAIQDFDDARLLHSRLDSKWDDADDELRADIARVDAILAANNMAPLTRLMGNCELLHLHGDACLHSPSSRLEGRRTPSHTV